MSQVVIKVENLSKLYRLGEIGSGTLRSDIQRWWAKLRGKEDPIAKIGHENIHAEKSEKGETIWALRNINFDVDQGEVLGIIGKNGAGKSTLLKILSQVTTPTSGIIKIKGRIASLLEVGTGFHPELTGRENIFLNGAILGMTKSEIRGKFDEIVDFAGVAKYIDTPVKRYSSGMYVRLAFAVAAHLEPEILIVDEVLAVGDDEFQNKALGKMENVSKDQGRTVLFVSHNMSAVRKLCKRCLLLQNGKLFLNSETSNVVDFYLNGGNDTSNFGEVPKNYPHNDWIKNTAYIRKIELINSLGEKIVNVKLFEPVIIQINIEVLEDIEKCFFMLSFGNNNYDQISYSASNFKESNKYLSFKKGLHRIDLKIHQKLTPGKFHVNLSLMDDKGFPFDGIVKFGQFSVLNFGDNNLSYPWDKSLGTSYIETEIINGTL